MCAGHSDGPGDMGEQDRIPALSLALWWGQQLIEGVRVGGVVSSAPGGGARRLAVLGVSKDGHAPAQTEGRASMIEVLDRKIWSLNLTLRLVIFGAQLPLVVLRKM